MRSGLLQRGMRFCRGRRAVASIEFALLAPMVFFVLAVALEASRLTIAYALIDHAVESGIHEAKLYRGQDAAQRVVNALKDWRFGVFDPSAIDLTFTSAASMSEILTGAAAGAGSAGQTVHLEVKAHLGILEKVLPQGNPMKGDVQMHYFYINEPEPKKHDEANE